MKITFGIFLFFNFFFAQAQPFALSFNGIDWVAQRGDVLTPETLAQQLTAPCKTDLEKVRAIFRWITSNISYAVRPLPGVNKSALRYKPLPMDSALALKSVDEIVAYTVLQKRTAVCNGYARLFKTLCGYAGIRAELVTGYARAGWGNFAFRPNHTWNAVYIDSAWRLVDVTWASGYVSFANEFVQQYDDSYFLPLPERFIYTHYPEDLRWSLLQNPPALHEFDRAPFKLTAFIKYGIRNYAPANGVIEAAVGDTLRFRFELAAPLPFQMAPELISDSMLMSRDTTWCFLKPVVANNEVLYTYAVQSAAVEWIDLVYNDDIVLRYKLHVRRPAL